ncbi:hypothetical protein [Achromobacter anxifer]|uniref:hypothetical protein n=1 Tax=Achromobacter anxifer TaxID=1287737 RepID=UPI001582993E|nr:hypothetical protein [Achromobacter anxifer]
MTSKMDQAKKEQDGSGIDVAMSAMAAIADFLVPAAGQALDFGRKLTAHLKARAQAREAQRIEEFCRALLSGATATKSEPLGASDAVEADFEAILAALLNDIEDEKTAYYANLARTLTEGTLRKPYIRPMILALKEISIHEIEVLRTSYIAQRHAIIPAQGPSLSSDVVPVDPNDPNHYGYRVIEQRGLVHEKKLTDYGTRFVEAICSPDLLTPESIGHTTWLTTCMFVSYEMSDDHLIRKLTDISERLREARIKVLPFCALVRPNQMFLGPPHAFVFFGPNWKNSIEYRSYLKSNLRSARMVVILLPGAEDESIEDLQPAEVIRGQRLEDIPALTNEIAQALIRGAPKRPTSEVA